LRTTFPPSGSGSPGLLLPPDTQVDDQFQPLVLERELPFMDDQPRVELLRFHRGEDLVERDHFILELANAELEREERRGQRPRHRDRFSS